MIVTKMMFICGRESSSPPGVDAAESGCATATWLIAPS
jgi:hypothetical protein